MDEYLQGQGQEAASPVGAYMDQGQEAEQTQEPTPEERWAVIKQAVDAIDEQTDALGVPTFDLFKKLGQPQYAGPNGINWEKVMMENTQPQQPQQAR